MPSRKVAPKNQEKDTKDLFKMSKFKVVESRITNWINGNAKNASLNSSVGKETVAAVVVAAV